MKRLLVMTILLQFVLVAGAQPPPRRDTVFGWNGSPNAPYYNAILHAPVVSGESQSIIIVPNRGPLCFDKRIKIKSTVGRTQVEQCIYINTQDGLTAYLKPQTAAGGNMCDIKPDDKDFWFSIIGLKGNVYNYHNTEGKNNEIKHWVSTGNTQAHVYQMPTNTGVYTLHNKHERRTYCDGKIIASAYKYDGATAPTMYLFGKNYPDDIHVTANKYIGNFGIGYQYTDKGLYIIMENVASGYTAKITSIEDVHVCFDPSPFVVQEEQFQDKRREDIEKERQRIARSEEEAMRSGTCVAEKMAVVNYNKELLRKHEAILETIRRGGNTYQDRDVQAAYGSLMDPLDNVRGGILATKSGICGAENEVQKHPESGAAQTRLACLNELLGKLMSTESQMLSNNRTFARSPAKARAENSKLLLQVSRYNCN